jgi:hypothetical protein
MTEPVEKLRSARAALKELTLALGQVDPHHLEDDGLPGENYVAAFAAIPQLRKELLKAEDAFAKVLPTDSYARAMALQRAAADVTRDLNSALREIAVRHRWGEEFHDNYGTRWRKCKVCGLQESLGRL